MELYHMNHKIYDTLWNIHNQMGDIRDYDFELILEELYGIRDHWSVSNFVEQVPHHFTYEIVDEEKFAMFILRFG